MTKKVSPLQNKLTPELEAEIAKLESKVQHAEENGSFDTYQHTRLEQIRAAVGEEPSPPEPAKEPTEPAEPEPTKDNVGAGSNKKETD
jgi:hypothetical protein